MKHLGIICPPFAGHLNPMLALVRALRKRGYSVSLVAPSLDRGEVIVSDAENFHVDQIRSQFGLHDTRMDGIAELTGEEALYRVATVAFEVDELLAYSGPDAIRAAQIDTLLVDQVSNAGHLVAKALALPFVTVCTALAMYLELDVPPWTTTWGYDPSPAGRRRNVLGYAAIAKFVGSPENRARRQRIETALPASQEAAANQPLAIVAQQPTFFDFPRHTLPPQFHYTGPFRDDQTESGIHFPYERLDGRPLIYASLGTLHNRVTRVFLAIARACARLPVQLVISLGGSGLTLPMDLPGLPIVVDFAPQRELVRRSTLVITSAGLNTVLDALDHGIPIVAIPISHEQPGIAARISHIGVGEFLTLDQVDEQLERLVTQVLTVASYRIQARNAQQSLAHVDGLSRAGDIVEEALVSRQPVMRTNH